MRDPAWASIAGAAAVYHVAAFLWTFWGLTDIFFWMH